MAEQARPNPSPATGTPAAGGSSASANPETKPAGPAPAAAASKSATPAPTAPKPPAPAAPAAGDSGPPEDFKGKRIGRILTKMGKVTREQVQEALQLQTQRRTPIGQLLIELGYCTEDDVNQALAAQAGMQSMEIESMDVPPTVIKLLPAEMAQSYQVVPLMHDAATNTLTVALKNANNFRAVDDLRLLMGYNVKPVIADPKAVEKLLQRYYGKQEESIATLINEIVAEQAKFSNLDMNDHGSIDLEELIAAAEDNKVKRLLNLVLLQGIKDKAADIHFEPFEDEFKMRYRIDGVLYEMIPPPKYLAMPIVSRIKVMANLDIAERRMPQDGRIELVVNGSPIDLRVAVLPTMFGESVVLRILDRTNVSLDLGKIGMRADDLLVFRQLINKPNGVVMVTGPTGSGKTTTLYSALRELNTIDTKICTAEEPVEYDIDGMVQVGINPEIEMTFAKALRSFLRQDPDIIFVGETRDLETAQISVQAALTGHLVFTTLHTNDAPSTVARLLDLGLEPFLLTATLEGVVAQRLIRRICLRCKEAYTPTEQELMEVELKPEDVEGKKFYRGRGCDFCNNSGYRGRMGLYEIMVVNDAIREMIMRNASTAVIREECRKNGMKTLRECGLLGVYDGLTTISEVVRETIVEG